MESLSIDYEIEIKIKLSLRLDLALLDALSHRGPSLSRNELKSIWKEHGIQFKDGSRASPSLLLTPGSYTLVILNWHPKEKSEKIAKPSTKGCFIPIAYEDEELLILDKPSGIPSLPLHEKETETAVGSALAHFPALTGIGGKALEPGLVHRLDTSTSGLLVFAKTEEEFKRLKLLWKAREVKKIYRALVSIENQELPPLPQQVNYPLAHHSNSKAKMIALQTQQNFRGKPLMAITHLVKTHSTPHRLAEEGLSRLITQSKVADLEIEIETGVMHQIRCHLAAIGTPIVGDVLYSGPPSDRIYLHAWKLKIPLKSGKVFEFESSVPFLNFRS